MPELLKEFWDVLLVLAGTIIYALRLEGKLNMFGVEIEILKKQRDEDRDTAQKSRDETHKKLDAVNDKLDRLIERLMGK